MPFKIDFNETFPPLPGAPIVEAVIHWRARAEAKLELDQLRQELVNRLPEYAEVRPQHEIQITGEIAVKGATADSQIMQRTQWRGFRLQREDEPFVAQFTFNGLVFSRLAPYDRWETFEAEALRLWDIFVELMAPAALQRLGVRFINRIELFRGEEPSRYLRIAKETTIVIDLPVETFLHRDVYAVPGTPYRINLVRTIQPPDKPDETRGLILDIDVFAEELGELEREPLVQRLAEMRWLKNKAFFSCITEQAKGVFLKEKS